MSHTFVRLVLVLHLLVFAAVFACASLVSACPFCDGPWAERVRREVVGDAFWPHALAAAAPLGVMLHAAGAVYGWQTRRPWGGR